MDVPFSVPTGSAGPAASMNSSAVVAIPDGGTATSSVTVSDPGRVKNVRVRIDRITHTYDGDLRIDLVAPDGTAVNLVNRRGGSGDDFVGTVFDQSAPTSIVSGAAPFTGTFRPEGDLGTLDGLQQQGDWTLRVRDASLGDTGFIQGWGLDVSPAVCAGPPPPPPPVDRARAPGLRQPQRQGARPVARPAGLRSQQSTRPRGQADPVAPALESAGGARAATLKPTLDSRSPPE